MAIDLTDLLARAESDADVDTLAAIRTARAWSQRAVADAMGTSRTYLCAVEAGRVALTASLRLRYLDALATLAEREAAAVDRLRAALAAPRHDA